MGLLDRVEARAVPRDTSWNAIEEWVGAGPTESGIQVTESSAMGFVAVWACVKVISEDLGKLPIMLKRRRRDGGSDVVTDHWAHALMQVPDPELDLPSGIWRLNQQGHVLTRGGAFARKHKSNGEVVRLEIIEPWRIEPKKINGRKIFRYREKEGADPVTLMKDDVLHIMGLGADGIRGYSPIQMAREAIAMGMAADQFAARFWGRGAHHDLAILTPNSLKPEQKKDIIQRLAQQVRGVDRSHSTLVVEGDAKVEKLSIPPEDAQFLQTRRFDLAQVARIYRVGLSKVQEYIQGATKASSEQEALNHLTDTLHPWATWWEQQLDLALLTGPDRRAGFYFEIDMNGVARADMQARFEALTRGISGSLLTPDEGRIREGLDPKGGVASQLWTQLNMVPITALPSEDQDGEPDVGPGRSVPRLGHRESRQREGALARRRLMLNFLPVFESTYGRLVRREAKALRDILKRIADAQNPLQELERELDGLYRSLGPVVGRDLLAALQALAKALRDHIGGEFAEPALSDLEVEALAQGRSNYAGAGYVGSSRNQIEKLTVENPDDFLNAISTRVDEWSETRSVKEALRAVVTQGAALTISLLGSAGASYLVWYASGQNCPLCDQLDGRRTRIDVPFLGEGSVVDPRDGKTAPLTIQSGGLPHPQLHKGCDCVVGPG